MKINGRPVLLIEPDTKQALQLGAVNRAYAVEAGQAPSHKIFNIQPTRRLTHGYKGLTQDESDSLMDFWVSQGGDHQAFYALSWLHEIDQLGDTEAGAETLQAEDHGMADLAPAALFILDLDNPENIHVTNIDVVELEP